MLILDKVASQTVTLVADLLQNLDELKCADDGVGARDGWDDVSCHIFDLMESLLLDRKTVHS